MYGNRNNCGDNRLGHHCRSAPHHCHGHHCHSGAPSYYRPSNFRGHCRREYRPYSVDSCHRFWTNEDAIIDDDAAVPITDEQVPPVDNGNNNNAESLANAKLDRIAQLVEDLQVRMSQQESATKVAKEKVGQK